MYPHVVPFAAETWLDRLAVNLKYRGVASHVIEEASMWLRDEKFDTDTIQLDANEMNVRNKDSVITSYIKDDKLQKAVAEFIGMTEGLSSLSDVLDIKLL